MSTIKEKNDDTGGRSGSGIFNSLKPVMFEYTYIQKPGSFDNVYYDYVDDVNKLQGKSVVECSQINTTCLTKTKVQRESDDSSNENLKILATKTDVQRESDDTPCDELAYATIKTFVERESDDGIDPYLLQLTKTRVAREADE